MIGTILLAVLGLSFLIFIHELGHYIVARRQGMRVEVFSIGFGKPICSWMHKGVKWQICAGLFGGYVKIAGMESSEGKDLHEIPEGFYSKSPWSRIKVALMGPLVNIVFAVIVFTGIWFTGGRTKQFEEHTKIIGWVDPSSELADKGVKPGDVVLSYNGKPFHGFADILQQGVLKQKSIEVQGEKVNYFTQDKTEYDYHLTPYATEKFHKEIKTVGILNLANSLTFQGFMPGYETVAPLQNSGIQKNDRIIWVNGETIFSLMQLSHIVQQNSVFITVIRNGERIGMRVPRISTSELLLTEEQKNNFIDWKRECHCTGKENFFIPYHVDMTGEVLGDIPLIDQESYDISIKKYEVPGVDQVLQVGDRIDSIGGVPVFDSLGIFQALDQKKTLIIVQREQEKTPVTWQDQDELFANRVDWNALEHVVANIGLQNSDEGSIRLLNPVTPVSLEEFKESLLPEQRKDVETKLQMVKVAPQEVLLLGANIQPVQVVYNPNPLQMCRDVVCEIGYILSSLFTGTLSPRWMSGPVGIIKGMSDTIGVNYREGFYLLGMISLNLGIVNLLPIPVLDGGHICFALFERITRRRISTKVMDRMILPFFLILITFFIYLTFHDVSRLFK